MDKKLECRQKVLVGGHNEAFLRASQKQKNYSVVDVVGLDNRPINGDMV